MSIPQPGGTTRDSGRNEGPAPPQFGTVRRMIVVQKALTVAAISMKFTRKSKMVFPVSWEARKLSLLPLFTITDV